MNNNPSHIHMQHLVTFVHFSKPEKCLSDEHAQDILNLKDWQRLCKKSFYGDCVTNIVFNVNTAYLWLLISARKKTY